MCREKLQNEKNKYRLFHPNEKRLIGIFIFGIIASATVLTIYFLEIYVATWLFWFGIVGVALTILIGAYLGLCIRKNYSKIKPINRALKVYDLNEVKNFKESESEKILVLGLDKKENTTMSNSSEINTNEKKNNPESELISTEENINNLSSS